MICAIVLFLVSFSDKTGAGGIRLNLASHAYANGHTGILHEAAFGCGGIIGKVFRDLNRNARQDRGEQGLPGVSLFFFSGRFTKTDPQGKFHVGCADIPGADFRSNLVVKLDTRTLPFGYYLIDDRPRDVILTRGKVVKLDFGAVLAPEVRLDLQDGAFETNSSTLKTEWLTGLNKLISVLDSEPSALRMTYYAGAEDLTLARERAAIARKAIEDCWGKTEGYYQLPFEVRVVYKK
jgi:hypothetical protein